jgi:hypothetical protein
MSAVGSARGLEEKASTSEFFQPTNAATTVLSVEGNNNEAALGSCQFPVSKSAARDELICAELKSV